MIESRSWIYKNAAHSAHVERLARELSIDETLCSLLVQRGVTSFDEAKNWFRPSLDNLHDPFLMKDMDKAVERLTAAISKQEKILFYGDYDVDGTTSVAIMLLFFSSRYPKVGYYIPDRYTEGYGLSFKGVDYAHRNGFSLMVTLDCGIKANAQVEKAREMGVDIIVCDHHNHGALLPPACAVLDPKRSDCSYPFKELSGCGVAFKLLQAYCSTHNIANSELFSLIDLVAVSIASDIVEITGENRIIAYHGLNKIMDSPSVGIQAIKAIARLTSPVSISDIVFKIGPRINAAGRIDSGMASVELLSCTDINRAMEIVAEVNALNETRKNLDKLITEEALAMIASDPSHPGKTTTVVYDPSWHKGVVGIVASRLTDVYYRPTIVLTLSNGKITGSARSVDGFDLHAAIEQCAGLLENFGGHRYAAGLTLAPEKLADFRCAFEAAVSSSILPDMLVPKVKIDAVLSPGAITAKFSRILKQFEPFGPGNMTPVFVMKGLRDTGMSRVVGDGSHLKLSLLAQDNTTVFDGIGFGLGNMASQIKNKRVDVCFALEENTFQGSSRLQLNVRDLKLSQEI